jgi:hypothetical protein
VHFEEQFRGAATVLAVFQDLQTNMGLSSGAQVLFGGCSAGARGAMVHLDNVAQMLAPAGITVRGLLDSSLWVNFPPMDPSAVMGSSLLNQTYLASLFLNADSLIPAACAAAYPGATWKCLFGQYRMPFLQTPYFLAQSQFDDFQTNIDCNASPVDDTLLEQGGTVPGLQQTIECFASVQQDIRTVLQSLPTPEQGSSGVFSSVCSAHCTTGGADYWTVTVNGASLSSLVAAWWYGNDTPYVVSSCTGAVECMDSCVPELQKFPQGFGATENVS